MDKKKRRQSWIGLTVCAALAVGVTGCGGKEAEVSIQEEEISVAVAAGMPQVGTLAVSSTFIGTVSPQEQVSIIPLVSGEVTEVNFEVGDYVEAGSVLVRIDDEAARLQLESAQLSKEGAQLSAQRTLGSAQVMSNLSMESNINSIQYQIDMAKRQYDAAGSSVSDAYEAKEDMEDALNKINDSIHQMEDGYDGMKKMAASAKNLVRQNESTGIWEWALPKEPNWEEEYHTSPAITPPGGNTGGSDQTGNDPDEDASGSQGSLPDGSGSGSQDDSSDTDGSGTGKGPGSSGSGTVGGSSGSSGSGTAGGSSGGSGTGAPGGSSGSSSGAAGGSSGSSGSGTAGGSSGSSGSGVAGGSSGSSGSGTAGGSSGSSGSGTAGDSSNGSGSGAAGGSSSSPAGGSASGGTGSPSNGNTSNNSQESTNGNVATRPGNGTGGNASSRPGGGSGNAGGGLGGAEDNAGSSREEGNAEEDASNHPSIGTEGQKPSAPSDSLQSHPGATGAGFGQIGETQEEGYSAKGERTLLLLSSAKKEETLILSMEDIRCHKKPWKEEDARQLQMEEGMDGFDVLRISEVMKDSDARVDDKKSYEEYVRDKAVFDAAYRATSEAVDKLKAAGYSPADIGEGRMDSSVANYAAQIASLKSQASTLESNVKSMDSNISSAETSRATTADSIDFYEDNLKNAQTQYGIQTGQAYQDTAAALANQIASTDLGIASARLQLENYVLTAPISGQIEQKNVDDYGMVSAGNPVYVISNKDTMTVTFYVSEMVRNQLVLGETVTLERNGQTWTAAVTQTGQSVDARTGLFEIKAMVEGSDLANGVTVKIYADTAKAVDALLIPYDAVYYQGEQAYVYCVENDILVKTPVETGLYDDDTVEITDGLTKDSVVVHTWSSQLADGTKVHLVEE